MSRPKNCAGGYSVRPRERILVTDSVHEPRFTSFFGRQFYPGLPGNVPSQPTPPRRRGHLSARQKRLRNQHYTCTLERKLEIEAAFVQLQGYTVTVEPPSATPRARYPRGSPSILSTPYVAATAAQRVAIGSTKAPVSCALQALAALSQPRPPLVSKVAGGVARLQ